MSNSNKPDQQYIPGLGMVRSYAHVDSQFVPPVTAPNSPEVPGFHKSLLGTNPADVEAAAEAAIQKALGAKKVGPKGANETTGEPKEEVSEDEAPEGGEPNSKDAEEAEESDAPDEAEPNSKDAEEAEESDAPDEYEKRTTKSEAVRVLERDDRVFIPKSQAAGSVRRAVQRDGQIEYVVALDTGAVKTYAGKDIQPMSNNPA